MKVSLCCSWNWVFWQRLYMSSMAVVIACLNAIVDVREEDHFDSIPNLTISGAARSAEAGFNDSSMADNKTYSLFQSHPHRQTQTQFP